MLQHNAHRVGQRAHVAHAAVVSLHALCCGLPILALIAAGVSGATSATALFSETVGVFHTFLHRYEVWIVAVSAALVAIGAALEAMARRRTRGLGFPWMFAVSVAAFLANVAIVTGHRM